MQEIGLGAVEVGDLIGLAAAGRLQQADETEAIGAGGRDVFTGQGGAAFEAVAGAVADESLGEWVAAAGDGGGVQQVELFDLSGEAAGDGAAQLIAAAAAALGDDIGPV